MGEKTDVPGAVQSARWWQLTLKSAFQRGKDRTAEWAGCEG